MAENRRRLSDLIIFAHRQAIEEEKAEVAELLIQALELDASYIGGPNAEKREDIGDVEAAFALHADFKSRQSKIG
jgi:hypothetical protein